MPQEREDRNMDLPEFASVLEESEKIIRQCFKQFQFEEVCLSFNGGKDCTVLLDIVLNVVRDIYKNDIAKNFKILYIRTNSPFTELETFVSEVEKHYGVNLKVMNSELKLGLKRLLEEDGALKACLMGTRRTDPYSENLNFMQMTDPNWPQILRVSPLLNWSYHQIWSYIIQKKVPYCSLYDKGYTSIGSTLNTRPNPSLASTESNGCLSYLPAWRLADASQERAGRGTPKHLNGNGLSLEVETKHASNSICHS